jgi:selenium metabolism protein YedF
MSEKQVDARGLDCPQPVVLVRRAMLEEEVEKIQVLLNSDIAAKNVEQLARSQGWEVLRKEQEEEIHLMLTSGTQVGIEQEAECAYTSAVAEPRIVIFIASSIFGSGNEDLGRVLMRAFIKTIQELRPVPKKVIFANSGVWLTTEGSELIAELRALEAMGIAVISCGTCLDFFHLNDKLKVGTVTNMFEIAQSLLDADRVVRP